MVPQRGTQLSLYSSDYPLFIDIKPCVRCTKSVLLNKKRTIQAAIRPIATSVHSAIKTGASISHAHTVTKEIRHSMASAQR